MKPIKLQKFNVRFASDRVHPKKRQKQPLEEVSGNKCFWKAKEFSKIICDSVDFGLDFEQFCIAD